jgi:capsular polysaccharide biosynthesis protein
LQKRLESQGFTAIDPAALPWEDQVLALRDCRLLVGVHGAGMTNFIFRGHQPLSVVEIFPPAKVPPHYYWLATLFGHRYTPIIAPTDFAVNIDQVAYVANTCML